MAVTEEYHIISYATVSGYDNKTSLQTMHSNATDDGKQLKVLSSIALYN